jgi:competence protein ComGC
MSTFIFSSPFLKYKNQKIYLFSCNSDLKLVDYQNELYYIDYKDIKISKSFEFQDYMITYDIISCEEDKNIVIRLKIDKEVKDDHTMIKIMYLIESQITLYFEDITNEHVNNQDNSLSYTNCMNDVYNSTNNYITNMYMNRFIKV